MDADSWANKTTHNEHFRDDVDDVLNDSEDLQLTW